MQEIGGAFNLAGGKVREEFKPKQNDLHKVTGVQAELEVQWLEREVLREVYMLKSDATVPHA